MGTGKVDANTANTQWRVASSGWVRTVLAVPRRSFFFVSLQHRSLLILLRSLTVLLWYQISLGFFLIFFVFL
jgi:hypothetical protein